LPRDLDEPDADDDDVQREIGDHDADGDPDRLLEALEEDGPQEPDQHQRDRHLVAVEKAGEGVLGDVAAASAAERVIVITNPVATKPIRTRTKSFPCHQESSFSSIEIEPSPWGLAAATRLYIGSAPKSVTRTRTRVAIGERATGGEGGDAGLVAEGREVVDPGQAHHLPPGVGMVVGFDVGTFGLVRSCPPTATP
jgi:hypothetical protein